MNKIIKSGKLSEKVKTGTLTTKTKEISNKKKPCSVDQKCIFSLIWIILHNRMHWNFDTIAQSTQSLKRANHPQRNEESYPKKVQDGHRTTGCCRVMGEKKMRVDTPSQKSNSYLGAFSTIFHLEEKGRKVESFAQRRVVNNP